MAKNPKNDPRDNGPVMPHPFSGQIITVESWEAELARQQTAAPLVEVEPEPEPEE